MIRRTLALSLLCCLALFAHACRPARVATPVQPGSGFVVGRHAYLARERQVHVVDLRDPDAPQTVATWEAPGRVEQVLVVGDRAYVVHRPSVDSWISDQGPPDGGVQIVDVHTARAPQVLGVVHTPDVATSATVHGDRVYVAHHDGVLVLDLDGQPLVALPPFGPDELGPEAVAPTDAGLVGVWGSCSATTGNCGGRFWLTGSDDAGPGVELTGGGMPGYDVVVVDPAPVGEAPVPGPYAAVAGNGLWVVDLADPAAPAVVASVTAEGGWYDAAVAARGSHLFLLAGDLYVYELAVPDSGAGAVPELRQRARVRLDAWRLWARDLVLVEDRLYVAAAEGLLVFDVTDPAAPEQVGALWFDGPPLRPEPTPSPPCDLCPAFPSPTAPPVQDVAPTPPLSPTVTPAPLGRVIRGGIREA